jgi:ATP-binding cassette subfamily B protein
MGKLPFIITHRIFSILQFDRILVLSDGEIIEEGTHQLIKKNGYYAGLFARQQRRKPIK